MRVVGIVKSLARDAPELAGVGEVGDVRLWQLGDGLKVDDGWFSLSRGSACRACQRHTDRTRLTRTLHTFRVS